MSSHFTHDKRKPAFKDIEHQYGLLNQGMHQVQDECDKADHKVIKIIRMGLAMFKK